VTYSLGAKSRERLQGVHPKLVAVVEMAIELTHQDFMVLEGVRTPARQRELYAQGRNGDKRPKVTWTLNSNHFINAKTGYGHAVDLVPFPVDWCHKKLDVIAKAMFAAADTLNTPIRWGRDWNRNGKPAEKGETDSPHFELVL